MLSTGINDSEINQLKYLIRHLEDKDVHVKFVCFDVANGYLTKLVKECAKFRSYYPYITIVAGNVVTPNGVKELANNGVDVVKVGIGSGAVCTTRIKTGCGYPQFSAVLECAEKAKDLGVHIIADGGITCPGDIAKALAAGSTFAMVGTYFAGHLESPGERVYDEKNDVHFKICYGMSSTKANNMYFGGLKNYRTSEGRVVKIKCKGKLGDTLDDIEGGLRSACTYTNSSNIADLSKNTNFVQVFRQFNSQVEPYTIGY
jgi:GMP reductase